MNIYVVVLISSAIASIATIIIRSVLERMFSSYGSVTIDLSGEKNKMIFSFQDEPEAINCMRYLRLRVVKDAKKTNS